MKEARPKILIVDDEVAQMEALCNTLRDHDYDVAGTCSATTALGELRTAGFDLILSDLMMPEMDGIQLLQAALKIQPQLVGVIMTGEGTIASAVEAMKSGAQDYILKPFKLSAILPVLQRALAVQRLRRENTELERQVQERTAQLEAANRELEAFAYSVSHDLRAPLRHIDAFSGLVLEGETGLSERGRNHLNVVVNSARRMAQLIDDLLNFSRNSRAELRRTTVSLQTLADDIIQRLKPEIESRNIRWKQGALPQVQADSALLHQVMSNLLLNAVKYTRRRDPAEIEIGSRSETSGEVVVFVRDNGAGFDMRYVDKLFGVFQRLHREDEFEGTGVGLANVRRIINRHGGRTWAEGKVDGGATFYFSLPAGAGGQ